MVQLFMLILLSMKEIGKMVNITIKDLKYIVMDLSIMVIGSKVTVTEAENIHSLIMLFTMVNGNLTLKMERVKKLMLTDLTLKGYGRTTKSRIGIKCYKNTGYKLLLYLDLLELF